MSKHVRVEWKETVIRTAVVEVSDVTAARLEAALTWDEVDGVLFETLAAEAGPGAAVERVVVKMYEIIE